MAQSVMFQLILYTVYGKEEAHDEKMSSKHGKISASGLFAENEVQVGGHTCIQNASVND